MRYALSLLLMMTPPLYFFLGWYLCARYVQFPVVLTLFAIVSSMFVAILALKAIVTGVQIRAEGGVLNLDFFGWPIYGSYGVLSLSGLLALDLFVIAGGFFAASGRRLSWLLAVGFAAAVFLLTGSNARGPQLALPYLAVILGVVAWLQKPVRAKAAMLVVVGLLSATYSGARMAAALRIVDTARQLSERASSPAATSPTSTSSASSDNATTDRKPLDFESLSTGRASLLEDSLADIKKSPLFGNGFGSFTRVDPSVGLRSVLSGNRTTHIQYLTALWKGGVLFFLPYMALLGAFWLRAIRGSRPLGADLVIVVAGLIFLFTILAFTWDILLVPSAGALAFFLLGAASGFQRRTTG
jgi:O-antigen ligase